MPANFDPYHAWLGIPRGSRPLNQYQLLGLKPFVSEPPVIAEAAETQKAKVSAHLQGAEGEDARRLLDEIESARKLLLSAAGRKAYDVQLRKQMGLPDPSAAPAPAQAAAVAAPPMAAPRQAAAVAAPVAAVPMATVAGVQAVPMAGMAPPMAAAVPMVEAPGIPAFGQPAAAPGPFGAPTTAMSSPMMSSRGGASRKKKSGLPMGVFIVAGAILILSGALTFAFRSQLSEALDELMGESKTKVAQNKTATTPPPTNVEPVVTPAKAPTAPRATSTPREGPPSLVPDDEAMTKMKTALESREAAGMPFADRMPGATGGKMPGKKRPDGKGGGPRGKMADSSTSPKTPVVFPDTKAGPEETSAVAKSLAASRTALGERNAAKAQEQLDLAMLDATSGDSLRSVERTRMLADLVAQFWNAVREGAKGLAAADEIQAGDTVGIVVEASDKKLSMRIEGKNRDYQIEKLPTPLARVIAERWLKKDDANSKLVVAAFLAVDPKSDAGQARELLELAAGDGANVDDLKAEMDAMGRD